MGRWLNLALELTEAQDNSDNMDFFDIISCKPETPMADLLNGTRKPINENEQRWALYHKKSPLVFEMFSEFTCDIIRRGYRHHSARAVLFRIRWETMKPHDDINPSTGKKLKISDHHSPYYGRLWMEQNPDYIDFFRTNKIRTQLT